MMPSHRDPPQLMCRPVHPGLRAHSRRRRALGKNRVDSGEVAPTAAQAVKFPSNEFSVFTQGARANFQSRSSIILLRDLKRTDLATGCPGANRCVLLKVERLAAVGPAYMCMAGPRYILTFCTAVLASPVLGVPFGSISKIWASSCATGRC